MVSECLNLFGYIRFGFSQNLEFFKKYFQNYMWICWIDSCRFERHNYIFLFQFFCLKCRRNFRCFCRICLQSQEKCWKLLISPVFSAIWSWKLLARFDLPRCHSNCDFFILLFQRRFQTIIFFEKRFLVKLIKRLMATEPHKSLSDFIEQLSESVFCFVQNKMIGVLTDVECTNLGKNLTQSLCFATSFHFFVFLHHHHPFPVQVDDLPVPVLLRSYLLLDFRRYMRICWIYLKELDDNYIVPVCLSQLWSKCPQHLVA